MDSMILLGQKNTLAEYIILSDADNRLPMLDKDLVAKDLWERVQLLMQGTSLTKQERECKLYDAFDKFTHIKGESLHKYYLRFTQLINDMNIYNIKMEQFQVNTKFLNILPPEWSKFVTDVKLVKDLHTTNFDQLHAYLKQHKLHANEVRLLRERNHDPLAFVINQQMTPSHFNTYQSLYNNPQLQQQFPLSHNATSSGVTMQADMQGLLNATTVKTEDLDTYDSNCDDVSNAKAVLMANIFNYGSDVVSEVPHSKTYLNDMENQSVHAMQDFEQTQVVVFADNEIHSDSNIIPYSRYLQETQLENVQDTNLQA
ncbi:hypothetical protein Tco_0898228 [Tanacetum coccineum]